MAVTKSPIPPSLNPLPDEASRPQGDLHVRILKKLTQSPTLTDAIADAATELVYGTKGVGFFHATRDQEGQLAPPQWIIAPPDARIIASPILASLCNEALNKSAALVAEPTSERRGSLMAAGIYFRGRPPEVLGLYAPTQENSQALFAALQLAATSVSLWGVMPKQPTTPTTLADRCIAACQDAETLPAAYERIALVLSDSLGVNVSIGERRASGGARMVASSAASRFSNSTSLARAAAEAMSAILASGEEQLWIYRDAINNESGPVMAFALAAEAECVFALPLATKGEPARIALLFFGNPSATNIEPIVAQLRAAAPKLASFLHLLHRMKVQHRLLKWLSPLARPFHGSARYFTFPIAIAIGLLLLLPVVDSSPADCSIEPASRRYIVSPQEGLLAKSLVEPGQTVKVGQELAHLDQHALELEIAAQEAALKQSQLRRDSALARGEAGQAGIFTVEARQAEESLALLDLRRDQLTVRSPIDGVVLRGDLQRTIGAPVTKGQVLFEVAPLEEMVAEIAIPEEEIHRVAAGMPVTARLDAFSGQVFEGQLDRIHPRAELREEQSVFIAEMKLNAKSAPLRPGMRGKVSITTARTPLAWSWIRRPITRLLRRLGW